MGSADSNRDCPLGSVLLPTFLFSVSLPLLPASSLSLCSDRPVSLVLTHLPLSPSLPPSLRFPEQNSNSSSPRWLALAPFLWQSSLF